MRITSFIFLIQFLDTLQRNSDIICLIQTYRTFIKGIYNTERNAAEEVCKKGDQCSSLLHALVPKQTTGSYSHYIKYGIGEW
jgi:hypothetical protein